MSHTDYILLLSYYGFNTNKLARIGTKTLYIETGSPWANGYNESFNGTLRDELLNGEFFYKLKETK